MSAEMPGSTTDDRTADHGDVAGRRADPGGSGPATDTHPADPAVADTAADPADPAEPMDAPSAPPAAGAGHTDDDPPASTEGIGRDGLDEAQAGDGTSGWESPVPEVPVVPETPADPPASVLEDTPTAPAQAVDEPSLDPTARARAVDEPSLDPTAPAQGVDEVSLDPTAPADAVGDRPVGDATMPADPVVDDTLVGDPVPRATVPYGGAPPADPPTLEQRPVPPAPAGRRVPPRERRRVPQRGLRITQRLQSVSPWSVLKVSVLFYLCTFLVVLVAGTLLWNIGRSAGAIDSIEGFITRLGAYGTCVEEGQVSEGVPFETDQDCRDGEVLVGGFEIDDGVLWRAAAIGGGVLVVAGSIGTVLMVVLLNLLSEVTGGVRHTVVTEPAGRARRRSTVAARRR